MNVDEAIEREPEVLSAATTSEAAERTEATADADGAEIAQPAEPTEANDAADTLVPARDVRDQRVAQMLPEERRRDDNSATSAPARPSASAPATRNGPATTSAG